MRGTDGGQGQLFNYVSLEHRIPADHPLRTIQALVEPILTDLSPRFAALYADDGRPSIPPEQLLRALLLQVLYGVRSGRQSMEQLDFNLLYRWFVGLPTDAAVWHPTTFTKNRDRLLAGDIAAAFLTAVVQAAHRRRLLSGEHFTVDGMGLAVHDPLQASSGDRTFKIGDAFTIEPGILSNATLVGANTVYGPELASTSTKPALVTAATSVVRSGDLAAIFTTSFGELSSLTADKPPAGWAAGMRTSHPSALSPLAPAIAAKMAAYPGTVIASPQSKAAMISPTTLYGRQRWPRKSLVSTWGPPTPWFP